MYHGSFLDQHLLKVSDSQLALASENRDDIYLPDSEQAFEDNTIHGLLESSFMFKLSFNMRWGRVFMESRVYKALCLPVSVDQHPSSLFPHLNPAVTGNESTFGSSRTGAVSFANPHVLLTMCQTSYKWYSNCRCFYIGEHPIFCPNFASNHPESLDRPFKPKLLTRTLKGLDVDLNGMSFISADVDNQRAPKGLTCPDIITFVQVEPAAEGCPLCERPHVLAAVHKKQAEGQRVLIKSGGTSEWKPMQRPVCETTSTGSSSVLGKENHLEQDQVRKQLGLLQITRKDKPAPRLVGGSNTRATQTKSQTPATRAPERRTDLAKLRGHRQNVSDSSTSSGGYPSSVDLDMQAGSPPCWSPLAD